MGLEYKIIQSERKELDKVTCDRCRKEIKKHSEGGWNPCGEPHSVYHDPHFDDYFQLQLAWGYGSQKDGELHTAILCEPCYDIVFKDVNITITNYM